MWHALDDFNWFGQRKREKHSKSQQTQSLKLNTAITCVCFWKCLSNGLLAKNWSYEKMSWIWKRNNANTILVESWHFLFQLQRHRRKPICLHFFSKWLILVCMRFTWCALWLVFMDFVHTTFSVCSVMKIVESFRLKVKEVESTDMKIVIGILVSNECTWFWTRMAFWRKTSKVQ